MTIFWVVAALFLLGALLLTLPPLLRPRVLAAGSRGANLAVHRDQLREAARDLADDLITPERFEQARSEIQRRVLEDTAAVDATTATARPARGVALALGVLIPLGSVLTYLALGNPGAAAPPPERTVTSASDGRHSLTPAQIEQMASSLAERLKGDPNNVQGWVTLARSYTALGRYRDASIALRRASDLTPNDPTLLADLADLVAMVQGKRLAGEPARLVQRALDLDPRHVKSLALAGSVAFEAKDYGGARSHWERLVALLPPDSPMLRSARGSIAEATALESGLVAATARAALPPAASASMATTAGARLSGSVQISPALAAKIGPADTLYVFARAAEGPRMPLAILRRGATLPLDFALDDSMAMSPQLKLSGFSRVIVGARISRSGNATPQSGDLIGESGAVAPGASGVRVLIEQVHP